MQILLKYRLFLLAIVFVIIPVIVISGIMFRYADKMTIWEKQHKLFGITQTLNLNLENSYETILKQKNALNAARQTQIQILHGELKSFTNRMVEANPGVRTGYYSLGLDAYIADAGAEKPHERVGSTILPDHKARVVMETGAPLVWEESTAAGKTLYACQPLIRGQKIIGCIWASEPMDEAVQAAEALKRQVVLGMLFWVILAAFALYYIEYRWNLKVNRQQQLNINAELQEILLQYQQSAAGMRPEVLCNLASSLPCVNADRLKLRKLLKNMLQQAATLANDVPMHLFTSYDEQQHTIMVSIAQEREDTEEPVLNLILVQSIPVTVSRDDEKP